VSNIYQMLTANGFTAFMRDLAAKLHSAGLLVTMAVPAKWSADDSVNDFAPSGPWAWRMPASGRSLPGPPAGPAA